MTAVEAQMTGNQGCVPHLIASTQRFPHGVRCRACGRPLAPGDRYTESLTGMVGQVPVVKVVCVPCDEGQHE